MEKNRIELTGTIRKMYHLKTKAGAPMAKMLLQVGKDTFWVLSYGNVAAAIGRLDEGDELSITGADALLLALYAARGTSLMEVYLNFKEIKEPIYSYLPNCLLTYIVMI